MALSYLKIHNDFLEGTEELTDDELGRLVRAMLQYNISGEAEKLPGAERIIFPTYKLQIDRDKEAYDKKCKKMAENIQKRWGKSKETGEIGDSEAYNCMQDDSANKLSNVKNTNGYHCINDDEENTTVYNCIQEKEKEKEKEEDKEKEKEKDNKILTLPLSADAPAGSASAEAGVKAVQREKKQALEQSFARFWEIFPKKRDKPCAKRAWFKLKPDEELVKIILQAVKTQKNAYDWQKDGGQFIPYPASWLNGYRWEDCETEVKGAAANGTNAVSSWNGMRFESAIDGL